MGITWNELDNHLIMAATEKNIPISGQFELTSRCNLQCKMCYVRCAANDRNAINNELTTKEWINLAEQARDAGMLYLLLTGGEVFLRQDFREIYEAVSSLGFNIRIYTNATLITPDIARWLGRTPPSQIGVTIYGSSPETYLRVCGRADGFLKAVHGFELLMAEGLNVGLRTTIIKENVKDFAGINELAEKRKLKLSVENYISPRRDGCSSCTEEMRLSPKELLDFEMYVKKFSKVKDQSEKSENNLKNILHGGQKEGKSITEIRKVIDNGPFSCRASRCSFWVTWDGRMTPCGFMDEPNAFPNQKGFITAWKELQSLCSVLPSCTECNECTIKEYCNSCIGRLKSETGYYDKPAPYLCDIARCREKLEQVNK